MKKVISVILAALMLLSLACTAFAAEGSAFGSYKHVYIIGIDGLGATWDTVDSPNFDRIFADNAYTHYASTEYVTVSAQNWGSILTGVAYDVHGFNNDYVESNERGSDSANNSIFYYVRQAMPDAELVSFNHWDAINIGIIENDINVKKINRKTDALVVDAIDEYFDAGNKPTLMFVQLDSVDAAGHSYGGQTKSYYSAAEKADTYLGMIYDSLRENDALEDSLFIVVSDHGEANGGGHGGTSKEESSTIVAVAGKSVNNITLPEGTRNRDVSAIALYALGVEQPSHMTSVVPEGLFGEDREKEDAGSSVSTFVQFFRTIRSAFLRLINKIAALFGRG